MANTYYNLYKQYKKDEANYKKYITALEKIYKSLTNSFSDEQQAVNKQLSELKDDLAKSVRHDSTFTATQNACETYKEKSPTSDANISKSVTAISDELRDLNNKKNNATSKKEYYYNKWKENLISLT